MITGDYSWDSFTSVVLMSQLVTRIGQAMFDNEQLYSGSCQPCMPCKYSLRGVITYGLSLKINAIILAIVKSVQAFVFTMYLPLLFCHTQRPMHRIRKLQNADAHIKSKPSIS